MASLETTRITMASRPMGVEQGDKTRRLVASDLETRVGAGARVRLRYCPQTAQTRILLTARCVSDIVVPSRSTLAKQ